MKMLVNKPGIFIVICLLCSCASINRKLYSPTQINTPSLQQKKDHNFSVSASAPAGFELHGSYALTNRIAIMGGLFSHRNKDEEKEYSIFSSDRDSSMLLYRHKGYNIGAGGYFPLISDKSSLFISVFGTYSDGSFKMNETRFGNSLPNGSQRNFYNSDINRWALQGSLHFYSKNIHQSLTSRYNHVVYSNVRTDYTANEQYSYLLPPSGFPRSSAFIDFGFDTKIFFTDTQALGLGFFGSVTARLAHEEFNFAHYPFQIGIGLMVNSPFSKKK